MAELYLILLHHPVLDKNGLIVTTALTNMDIHDIARSARTYGVRHFYVATPVRPLQALATKIMAHWESVLPGEILTVQHEDVIDNLEREVRRILDFCGLGFEQTCLEYYKTERSVRTPSSEQVRQPIFRDSVDSWQNFEPWLGPLKQALESHGN